MTTWEDAVPPPLLHALEELLFPDIWVPGSPHDMSTRLSISHLCFGQAAEQQTGANLMMRIIFWTLRADRSPDPSYSKTGLQTPRTSPAFYSLPAPGGDEERGWWPDGNNVLLTEGRVWYLVIFRVISLKCVEILFCFGRKWANYLLFWRGRWFYKWLVWFISLIGCHSNVW